MIIPSEARCRKAGLHDFHDVSDYADATVEMCTFCSTKIVWRKDDRGRMDNRRYLRVHLRSFCQPFGTTAKAFALAYGEKAWKQAVKKKQYRLPVDWEQAGRDALNYLRSLKTEKAVL